MESSRPGKPVLAKMCDGIHEFGSFSGAELNHAEQMSASRYGRDVPLAPSHLLVALHDPVQARAMDLEEIRALRKWHRGPRTRGS